MTHARASRLSRIPRSIGVRGLAYGLLFGIVGPMAAPHASFADKVKDDDLLNYFLKVPDRWTFGRAEDYAKQNVVAVADCVLDLLADGKTVGTGQGGRVMLSVQDVPKEFEQDYETWLYEWQLIGAKIEQEQDGTISDAIAAAESAAKQKLEPPLLALAKRPDVQSLLLSRWFSDIKKQPVLEPDVRGIWIGHIPAAEMTYEGNCANLQGNDGRCLGRLYVWVVRKKLYRMAFWVWPTEYDREHVKDDVDTIQFSYETPKPTAIPRKPTQLPAGLDPNGPKVDPDLEKVFPHRDLAYQFEIRKVKRFRAMPVDRSKPDQKHLGYRMDGVSGASSCICELLVYAVKNAAEPFIIDDYLMNFWTVFVKGHPNGKLESAPFVPVTNKQLFLSLPNFGKKFEVDRPEKKPGKDKEEKTSVSELEKKLLVIAESKMVSIGKERVKNTWRICLMGNAERAGDEVNVQYIFQTDDFCYVFRFVFRRDGVPAFKDAVTEILSTFLLIEPPK